MKLSCSLVKVWTLTAQSICRNFWVEFLPQGEQQICRVLPRLVNENWPFLGIRCCFSHFWPKVLENRQIRPFKKQKEETLETKAASLKQQNTRYTEISFKNLQKGTFKPVSVTKTSVGFKPLVRATWAKKAVPVQKWFAHPKGVKRSVKMWTTNSLKVFSKTFCFDDIDDIFLR